MAYGYIYKITNTVNDKVYIGQTTKSVLVRFEMHKQASMTKSKQKLHLYLAMNKYGMDKFSIVQIDSADSREELNEKERYWIKFYDSISSGYNMMEGGNDENPMNSPIVKEKHASKLRDPETRQKISQTMSKFRLEQGFSAEHKQKIKESRHKRMLERKALGLGFYDHPEHMASRSLGVYCILDTGERFDFDSILHAGKWWYEIYKPFGETYSTATYQRKIEASIAGKDIVYGNKTHKKYKIITNIKWFRLKTERKEGDAHEKVR